MVGLTFPVGATVRHEHFFRGTNMDPLKAVTSANPTKKVFSLYEEFRNFAFKGNVIDLAVGVIIGAAFGKIIASLVENIVMPLVSLVLPSDQGYQDWKLVVDGKQVLYGKFLADVLNFLIVAVVLFIFIVKFVGWMMRTRKQEAAALPPLSKEQELLTEIRDLLRQARPGESSA